MDERAPVNPSELRLTSTEAEVLRALTERERDVASSRLSHAYRRLLELSRGNDSIDATLVAHLAREILSASPAALGIELPSGRLEYENRIGDLSVSWPPECRAGEAPAAVVTSLRRILDDHDAASERAREGPRALLTQEDRSRAGFVPKPAIDRWIDLSRRGSTMAHRLRSLDRDLPTMEEARRLVDELSATLLATVAPFFAGIGELDAQLALEAPGPDDARHLADLLRTASQYAYFFDRAGEQWLRPLASVRGLLTNTPDLIDVGGGYVRAPDWSQGRFIARVASSDPALAASIAKQVPVTTNPRVVVTLVAIARSLPVETAALIVRRISERMSVPLAIEYAGIDAGSLARELAVAGRAQEAAGLLMSVVDAAIGSGRDDQWHLEHILATPVDEIAAAGGDLGSLRRRLRRSIGRKGPAKRYSTMWLRRVDRRPGYGPDETWLLANALYRVLLAEPLDPARTRTRDLIASNDPVSRRIGLAAIAQRPELTETSDALLLDTARWDDPNSTRYEFRSALGVLWGAASEGARESLLLYAESADEWCAPAFVESDNWMSCSCLE